MSRREGRRRLAASPVPRSTLRSAGCLRRKVEVTLGWCHGVGGPCCPTVGVGSWVACHLNGEATERDAEEEGFRRTPTWRAKCRISGSGRPLRFEHWGARGDLSPTDLRPISSRALSWKQRTTQGTRGLYWFGPPLWCNALLQCVVWWIALGLVMNSTREEQPRERCS